MKRRPVALLVMILLTAAWILLLRNQWDWGSNRIPAIGDLIDPMHGLYHTARLADYPDESAIVIPTLEAEVTVHRDGRGVPHIFAETDLDAIRAVGYVTAQDRLFQLDFLQRIPSGSLAEILGPDMIDTDRYLRSTGMAWGASKTEQWYRENDTQIVDMYEAYCEGVNTYIDRLEDRDLPFEMRLLGYRPKRCSFSTIALLLQFFHYDLSWRSDDIVYTEIAETLGDSLFKQLFPEQSRWYVPIIPDYVPTIAAPETDSLSVVPDSLRQAPKPGSLTRVFNTPNTAWEGFVEGKGSNNWAVTGDRSTTGSSILAGDPHLRVTLPSVWYEFHLESPSFHSYGVALPGAPVPIIGFTDFMTWTMTNTGADQIDHYALTLDSSGEKYRYDGGWKDLTFEVDSIFVRGGETVLDTVRFAHWGPLLRGTEQPVAIQWTAHRANRSLRAIWEMHRSEGMDAFQKALGTFDGPMQNILAADNAGNIAIRSTGHLPIRGSYSGGGLLDGSDPKNMWVGRVSFEELPYSQNPDQGFLTSTNQQPAGPDYPHYQRLTWRDSFRSLRADSLLRGKDKHSAEDLMTYQSDVVPVQWQFLKERLRDFGIDEEALEGERAIQLYKFLQDWDGATAVDEAAPLILEMYLDNLRLLTWDESIFSKYRVDTNAPDAPVRGVGLPAESVIWTLLTDSPESSWLDVVSTEEVEKARDLLILNFAVTADSIEARYGWGAGSWRWGEHHKIRFNHLLNSASLAPLGRGPFEFPGFRHTLLPASGHITTFTASWRMVVDFDGGSPKAVGVFPGGPSGNPFSKFYDLNLDRYLSFTYFDLHKDRNIADTEKNAGFTARYRLIPAK